MKNKFYINTLQQIHLVYSQIGQHLHGYHLHFSQH